MAERFGLDFVDLSVYDLDMGAVNLISAETAKRYQAIPVGFTDDGTLLLAMANPTNVLTIDDVAMMTGRRVKACGGIGGGPQPARSRGSCGWTSRSRTSSTRRREADAEPDLLVDEADGDAPVIKLVHSIVAQAVQQGASDIHVNPEEGDTRVLFRVDGVLSPAATIKRRMAMGVVSRIKIMADLDISEKRVPQDGRFALTVDGRRVDIRVVTLPLVYGEGVVMRILDKGVVVNGLESLGMPEDELDRFTRAIKRPNGAVLVTGPTGSGKSTTLYAALNVLNDGERSILTIEDPVEQRIAGIKQMQIAPKAGVTFDVGPALDAARRPRRDHGRRDPRPRDRPHRGRGRAHRPPRALDPAHARCAQRARAADRHGHRAVPGVLGGRLHRRPAPRADALQALQEAAEGLRGGARRARPRRAPNRSSAVGCSRCGGSGYRGRVGVYEVMSVSEPIRALILERASVDEMVAVAVSEGMRRLRDDGLEKVREGLTSIAEIERMTNSML